MFRPTSKEKYWEMLEILPPEYMDGSAFLVGEPMDHGRCAVSGEVLPRFEGYVRKKGRYFVTTKPLTVHEFKREVRRLR